MKNKYVALIVSLLTVLFLGIIFLVKNQNTKINRQAVDHNVGHQELASRDEDFETFKNSFLYQRAPVHPRVIERFISFFVSDDWRPKTIAMDISACPDTNEFFGDFEWSCSDNKIHCSFKQDREEDSEEEEACAYFDYIWLGKLKNGLHVVETIDRGGGTMIMKALIFFKVSKGSAFTPTGEVYSPILLTFMRNYCWYNAEPEIELVDNQVVLIFDPECKEPEKVVLDFPSQCDFN